MNKLLYAIMMVLIPLPLAGVHQLNAGSQILPIAQKHLRFSKDQS